MTEVPPPRLSVRSDLNLTVDDLRADLIADGTELELRANDGAALLRRLAAAPTGVVHPAWRGLIGQAAQALADAGLTMRVADDRGTLVELGADCRSLVARLALGSEHVRLGASRALLPTLAALLSDTGRRIVVTGAGTAMGAVIVLVAARRRAHGTRS